MRRSVVLAALLAGLGACGPSRPDPSAPVDDPDRPLLDAAAPDAAPADDTGAGITPRAYLLELGVDPDAAGYTGLITIDLDVAVRSSAIWLDARDLTFDWASLEVGDETLPLTLIADPPEGRLGLELPRPIDPGTARLQIDFDGSYRSDDGVFAQTYRAHTYVFSDFEPVDARRAFPCFDDPRFKTPWTVKLVVPPGMVALSNAPAERTVVINDTMTRVEFAPTPPLPSYLVAIAVGPFDLVEADGGTVPVRIAVPSGRQAAAADASAFTPEILATAAAFLDRPVPFAKLDVVAVPRFGGAMENPGLVTVAAEILLDGRGEAGQRQLALVLAHEVSHLWFGDHVTLTDWRDLWINEGFASWMADEVLARWRPAWSTRRDEVGNRFEAMRDDDLPGTHALRPETLDGPRVLFDVLTYQKSAALLHMVEDWVGADRFLEALRGYLDDRGGGGATGADVLAALAPLDEQVVAVMTPLLERPGLPRLDAELSCDRDAGARLRLQLRAVDDAPAPWLMPVCVRWHDGSAAHRACTVVADHGELALGDRCPRWVHPSAGATGYYRWTLAGASLAALIGGAGVSDVERLDATLAVRDALAAGAPLRDLAAALAAAVRTGIPEVVEAAVADYRMLLEQVGPRAARKPIAAHLRAALAPAVRRLGLVPRAGESNDDRRLRPIVLGAAGDLAGDAKVIAWARKAARRWLDDPEQPPPAELLEPVLMVAAAHADAKMAAALMRVAESAMDATSVDAQQLARALGRMPRTRAVAALEAALGGGLPPVSVFTLAVTLLARADTAAAAVDALARQGDWLSIALTFAPTCDPTLLDRLGEPGDDAFGGALARRRVEATRCAALGARATGAARAFKK